MTSGAERQARYMNRLRSAATGSPPVKRRRRNVRAIEQTIAELRRGARLDDVDAAFVAAARTTAEALDEAETPYIVAMVVRSHLVAVAQLVGRPSTGPDEFDAFIASLRAIP